VTAFILIMDQLTKAVILSNMGIGESVPIITGFFSITHVRNPGAAFGFLASASPMFRNIFFLAVTIMAVLLILYYIKNAKPEEQYVVFPLSLILGGALGNLIDRVRFGDVVDFLDVYIGTHHWPAFNVADSSISIGAIVLLWLLIMKRKG
jgi:signal peptidase II